MWAGTGGTATVAWRNASDTPRGNTGYGRITWTAAPSSGGGYASSTAIVPGGTTYTWSMYIRPSVTIGMYPSVQFYNSSGTPTTSPPAGTVVSCPANQWTRISFTGTMASTDAQYQFRIYANGAGITSTTTIDYDDCLVEATDTLQPYFDGSSKLNLSTDPQFANSNNGSLLLVSFDPNVSHTGNLGSRRTDTTGGVSTIISTYGNGAPVTPIVTPGVSYTFSSWVLIKSQSVTSGYLRLNWRNSSGSVTSSTTGTTITIQPGSSWVQLSVTGVAPTDAASMYVTSAVGRISGNNIPGEDVGWIADALLEAGATSPGPFYQGLTPAWTGTANASTSVLNGAAAVNGSAAYAYSPYGWTGWATGNGSYCVLNPKMNASASLSIFSVGAASLNPQANAGEYWSGQFEARVVPGTTNDPVTMTAMLYGYNNSSSTGNTTTSVGVVLPTDGSWQSVSAIAGVPMGAGTTNVRWLIYLPTTAVSGAIFEVRKIVTEKVAGAGIPAGPYFDGNNVGNTDITYRWTGAADLSTSQQYIAQAAGPVTGNGTYSTMNAGEHWFCDYTDLTNYAFGITKVENSTPEISGTFTSIPQRNGVVGRPNRSYAAGELSLSMWVVGCTEGGTVPDYSTPIRRALFERNLSMLHTLLGAQNGPVTLMKYRTAPGDGYTSPYESVSTRAYLTGSTSIDTMLGRQRAEVVFTFTLIDSFWTNINPNTASVTGIPKLTVNLDKMGDAPVDDAVITITGPVNLPTVTCPESGVSFSYNGNLTTGQTLVVDCNTWDAKIGSTSVVANMSHSGHARFMYIPPRSLPTAMMGAFNFYPTLTLTGSGGTAVTGLSVKYSTKYQVA